MRNQSNLYLIIQATQFSGFNSELWGLSSGSLILLKQSIFTESCFLSPFWETGSRNFRNPGGIPVTVSQENPPSGSRKGSRRSRLSSSRTSRPSPRISLSAEASAAATTASISSCSSGETKGTFKPNSRFHPEGRRLPGPLGRCHYLRLIIICLWIFMSLCWTMVDSAWELMRMAELSHTKSSFYC